MNHVLNMCVCILLMTMQPNNHQTWISLKLPNQGFPEKMSPSPPGPVMQHPTGSEWWWRPCFIQLETEGHETFH